MKKVIIISNIPSPYSVDLYYYLQENKADFHLFILYTNKNEDNRNWKLDQHKLINMIVLKSRTVTLNQRLDRKYIHFPKGLTSELNRISPDIVIGSEYNPSALLALCWCKKHHKPFIHYTEGTRFSEQRINAVQKGLRKYIIGNSSAFIACGQKAKEKVMHYGVEEENIDIAYLSVDIRNYSYQKSKFGHSKLLYVGRLAQIKGVDLLLQALKHVKKDFTLTIVGDGDKRNELEKLTVSLGLEHKVAFLGYLDGKRLLTIYKESDIFVLPSRSDCYGLVLLEAMCASMPVICSKHADGAYDLIDEGMNGYIIDPFHTSEFVKAVERVMFTSEVERMGCFSYSKAQQFHFKNIAAVYYDVISRFL